MKYEYIYKVVGNSFWVYSDIANVDYLITVEDFTKVEEAKEIAEREITKWLEAESEEDEYFGLGYVEVVKEAYKKKGIEAKFYIEMED